MKKAFIILAAFIVVAGLLTGIQYNERKASALNPVETAPITQTTGVEDSAAQQAGAEATSAIPAVSAAPQPTAAGTAAPSTTGSEEVWDGQCH